MQFGNCCSPSCFSHTPDNSDSGRSRHDVTAFSGAPLRQFTQPLRRLWFPKITLWKQPSEGLAAPWPLALRCHATQSKRRSEKTQKLHHINKGLTLFVGGKDLTHSPGRCEMLPRPPRSTSSHRRCAESQGDGAVKCLLITGPPQKSATLRRPLFIGDAPPPNPRHLPSCTLSAPTPLAPGRRESVEGDPALPKPCRNAWI